MQSATRTRETRGHFLAPYQIAFLVCIALQSFHGCNGDVEYNIKLNATRMERESLPIGDDEKSVPVYQQLLAIINQRKSSHHSSVAGV